MTNQEEKNTVVVEEMFSMWLKSSGTDERYAKKWVCRHCNEKAIYMLIDRNGLDISPHKVETILKGKRPGIV